MLNSVELLILGYSNNLLTSPIRDPVSCQRDRKCHQLVSLLMGRAPTVVYLGFVTRWR